MVDGASVRVWNALRCHFDVISIAVDIFTPLGRIFKVGGLGEVLVATVKSERMIVDQK